MNKFTFRCIDSDLTVAAVYLSLSSWPKTTPWFSMSFPTDLRRKWSKFEIALLIVQLCKDTEGKQHLYLFLFEADSQIMVCLFFLTFSNLCWKRSPWKTTTIIKWHFNCMKVVKINQCNQMLFCCCDLLSPAHLSPPCPPLPFHPTFALLTFALLPSQLPASPSGSPPPITFITSPLSYFKFSF